MQESLRLDTANIPYKTLYTRVIGWSNLLNWNSKDTTSFAHLKQSWYDIEHSKNTVTNTLPLIKNKTQLLLNKNVIPIINIDYKFSYINANAIKRGTLRIKQNKIVQTAKRGNPYLIKHINIVGLAIDKVYANTVYQLKLDKNFILSNLQSKHKVRYVIINTSTNQTYKLSDNQSINIRFTKSGINVLKIIAYNGNKEFVTYQSIKVVSSTTKYRSDEIDANEHKLLTSTIPFKGYDETIATTSYADYHIFYHYYNNTTTAEYKLKKPIIIVDGFDPQNQRSYKRLYNYDLVYGNKKLGEELRKKGYDIIILNFPMTGTNESDDVEKEKEKNGGVIIPLINGDIRRDGGTDYIERNAFLLVKLIQTINAKLTTNGYGNQKLVVVGPSMGGLISRYALAYMEKHNMNHNTGLWISFDAPHLGANIPLAIQKDLYFFGYNGEQEAAQTAYELGMRCPATRQMLIEQLDGLNGASSFFQQFFSNMTNNGLPGSNGFPQNLRKIALVNGSSKGIKTNNPNDMFLKLDAKKLGMTFVKIRNRFIPSTYETTEYFRGKVSTTGFIYVNTIEIGSDINNKNTNGSMDVMPGGTYSAQDTIKEEFDKGLPNFLNTKWTIKHNHCFIPLISALAFNNSNLKWDNRIDNRDLVETGEIPFDNYYVPEENQPHIKLTEQSVFWLLCQLNGNYFNQYNNCKISGSSLICDQATYTIENLPKGATVEWGESDSHLSLLTITAGQGTKTAVFKAKWFNGLTSITANITIGNNTFTLTKKNIWVGTPSWKQKIKLTCHSHKLTPPIEVGLNSLHTYFAYLDNDDDHDFGDFKWSVDGQAMHETGNFNSITYNLLGINTLRVSRFNECGEGAYVEYKINVVKDGGSGNGNGAPITSLKVYPNPAHNDIELILQEQSLSQKESREPYVIEIWNSQNKVKTIKLTDNKVFINISDLPKGFYYIILYKNEKTYKQTFIKY